MPFNDAMNTMLPTQNGTAPHVTGNYGENRGSSSPHGGVDFNYQGGQSGINLTNPTVYSPIGGTVTFVGGRYGTIRIRDAGGNSHEILHTYSQYVTVGDAVKVGDAIGTMGGRGPKGANEFRQHVHYQMKDPQGRQINPQDWWDNHHQPGGGGDAADGASGSGGAADGAGGSGGGGGAAGGTGRTGGNAGADGTTPPRRDPLVLDLDGDGIETTSVRDGTVIVFDHDADGVKTGTGWVRPDDGWLVLDRNGNGTIDSGRELFGVDTLKSNGQWATDGFDALRDLDANQDGKIDSADSVFTNLRIWRDLNQDGISQTNELTTLSANDVVAIGVNTSAMRTDLGNGNAQTAAGTFTRFDGTTGQTNGAAANLDLMVNTFYRQFTDHIPFTDQAKGLPTLRGSGQVRDLNEAISLSTDLGDWVQTYTQQTTRQGQIDKLDGFIEKWADTSDLQSLKAQADALAGSGVRLTYHLTGLTAGTQAYDEFVRKLGVIERFMGFTYGGANGQARLTPLDASSGNITVTLAAEQIASISLAYDRFKTDIYESLLLRTRLNPYFNTIDIVVADGSMSLSYLRLEAAFEQAVAASPRDGIIDLVEFLSAAGETRLKNLGWNAIDFLITQINATPDLGAFSEELSSWTVRFAASTEHNLTGTSRPDLLVGTAEVDYLYGRDGNDILSGKGGDDHIHSGNGDDTLDGGAGSDTLNGGYGNNIYQFGKGDGQDLISGNTNDTTAGKLNTLQFKEGVATGEIVLRRVYDNYWGGNGALEVSIAGTTDKIVINGFFYSNDPANGYNPVQ
ncbi:peptidase M23, partial [Verminephrobacter eiseniae]|nr:peptidase M23 [Verminephrobacter eiseniae]MCW8223362.1 peptidase M23 [Verminephrobacter eiseniae]